MSDSFRNPYHFVPTGPGAPPERLPTADITAPWAAGSASAHLTHDRYVPGTHSGRITCRATVETPLICGNKQEERPGWTKLIHPFEIEKGKPALPASGLRGMLSALAEAATHSTLRVLKGDVLSFRRNMNDPDKLSALGLIVAGEKEGELRLRPLALPTMDLINGKYIIDKAPGDYRGLFPTPALKVYLGNDRYDSRSFQDSNNQPLRNAMLQADGQLGPFYGMKLTSAPDAWSQGAALASNQPWQRHPTNKNKRSSDFGKPDKLFLIGRQPVAQQVVPWEEGMAAQGYTRGVFRGLGLWTAERQKEKPPSTKKHEFFIPYTPDMEQWASFPILPQAIQRFHELADQRTDENNHLPYEPLGTRQRSKEKQLRLKPGDIVYFRPKQVAGKPVIAEVSFSSIWRGRVEDQGRGSDTRAFFEALSSDLLPLHPGRSQLTLAEQLFGTVEVRDKQQQADTKTAAFSLASRLRISHGTLHPESSVEPYLPYTELLPESAPERIAKSGKLDLPLQNLASPKPPSPALYFRTKPGQKEKAVKKHELNVRDHQAQGRKFYLRRRPGTLCEQDIFIHPARLGDDGIADQHQSVKRFVRPDTQFEFHLDFTNLSPLELSLLVYVLQPSAGFRHQLGHGKPLGLGQIQIEVTGLDLTDRLSRYLTDDLTAPRHQSALDQVSELHSGFRTWAAKNKLSPVLQALELLGTPPADDLPIHYPQAFETDPDRAQSQPIERGSAAFEKEHFRWFVQNEKLRPDRDPPQQYLQSLIGQTHLPTLRREQGRPDDGPRGGGVPAARGAPAPRPGPARAPVSQAANAPESLVGTVQTFKLLHIKGGKPRFIIVLPGFTTEGTFINPTDKEKFLAQSPKPEETQLPLLIKAHNMSTFQLTLPAS